jgi:hypothetical protein
VIVEVHPKQEKFALYLDLAKGLKPILEEIDGFIDNERFESIRPAGLDPVALNLARREIRGEVADGREASRHSAARPGLGVSGLPLAGGRERQRHATAGRRGVDLVEDHIDLGIRFAELPSSAVRNSEYAATRASSEKLLLRPLGLGRTQVIVPANPVACWPHSTSGWPIMVDKARFPRKAIERGA